MRKVLRKLRNHGITLPQGILLSEEDLDRIEEDLASIKIAEDRAKELHDEGHAEIIATYLAGIEGIIDYATLCSDFETWCQVFAIRLP
jgi:hypothetical protein